MGAPELISGPEDLRGVVRRLAAELDAAYPDGVVLVAVLKGSLLFLADLVRAISVPTTIGFLALSSYAPDSTRARILLDLDLDVAGRDVVVVEDLVDTGLSLGFLTRELARREPRSLAVCALLDKEARRILPTEIRFRGLAVGDVFLLGYGLDFAGRYRNLDRLVAVDPEVLTADPDAFLADLYGSGR